MKQQMRSALFVPATRPERFAKALAAGADAVIIDLEDAVEPDAKDGARQHVGDFASAHPQVAFCVRVNGHGTPWFDADLALCASHGNIDCVLLPKAESAAQIAPLAGAGKSVLPIVESAMGVLSLAELAAAPGVQRLSFGSLDLMLDTGTAPDTKGASLLLDYVRCQILLHSAACGLAAPLDGVYPDFSNAAGLAALAAQVRDMGFGGMLCIHPAQVPTIHAAFAPTAAQVDWASRVVAKADSTGSFAFQMDGKMVDAPVIERARQIIAAT
ncbi:MAG TPA: CoA ester lyase [Candidimonas sp.]|nr:CoA ester lyase [Candidimonas sp.]